MRPASLSRCLASLLLLAGALSLLDCRTSTGSKPEESTASAATKIRFDRAPDGDVPSVVLAAVAREKASGRRLVVYEGAVWCEPCKNFHQAVAAGKLDATFPDLTLLEFDIDKDRDRLVSAGYVSEYIPLFALPGKDGRPAGPKAQGGIKGDAVVPYLTKKLQKLLSEGT